MENNKTVSFDDFKKEATKKKIKDGFLKARDMAVNTASRAVEYGLEHPGQAIAALSAFGVAAGKVAKIQQTRAEDRRRDCDFYDPRKGKHAISKRKPTRKELLEIDRRYERGESYVSILNDMGLLK